MKRIKFLSLKALFLAVLLSVPASQFFAADFSIRLLPAYDIALDSAFDNVISANAALDLSLFTVRSRDEIKLSAEGGSVFMFAPNVDPVIFYNVGGALGYNLRITDRIAVDLEADGGVWMYKSEDEQNLQNASGPYFGGRVTADYYISPVFKLGVFGGYKNYYYKPKSFLQSIQAGVSITMNLTKSILKSKGIQNTDFETQPLFPIFYAHYDNNSFGTVTFTNIEKNTLTDVEVSVFIEQFMSVPKVIATFDKIKPGEEFSAELTAFLNESIMNQMQKQMTDAQITITYKNLGQKNTYEERFFLQTLTRNSMSWEDDRRAAAFVSAKDGAVQRFAKQITLALKDTASDKGNYIYANAIFDVLKAYGINYVVDPTSVFSTSDTVAVDFLQFPYQTLLYHGGDCDDLSILNCSLFEALGIQTAFITIPGHIYMAYDSGLSQNQAARVYGKGKYIVQDDKVWIPLEITVPQDSFELSLKLGIREWDKYSNDHNLIPIHDAWNEFKPITVPESDVSVQFPKEALTNIKQK